jgi:hypothetical protein
MAGQLAQVTTQHEFCELGLAAMGESLRTYAVNHICLRKPGGRAVKLVIDVISTCLGLIEAVTCHSVLTTRFRTGELPLAPGVCIVLVVCSKFPLAPRKNPCPEPPHGAAVNGTTAVRGPR